MSKTETPSPNVILNPSIESSFDVNFEQLGSTMHELGIPDEKIQQTTVYIDGTDRLASKGVTYPNLFGRLRHRTNPKLHDATGPMVRISTVVRGKERTDEEINRTAVHELEHIAQIDRKDPKLYLGWAAICGLGLAGALVGNKLGNDTKSKVALSFLGAAIGQQAGYALAPHERQARSTSEEVKTSAIKRRTSS